MARLSVYLLGPFHVTLDGKTLTGFESNRVRALLAYLTVEAGMGSVARPHTRDTLIGLLWPDCTEHTARRNLSQALFNLRQVLHDDTATPPFLDITRETIRLNPESDSWLDVAEFERTVQDAGRGGPDACALPLASCVELYRGEFMAGFHVDDSLPFAEWASLLRERLHRQVMDALYRLAAYYLQQRHYDRAQSCARRQVELEPWREEAHHQLMGLFVRSGERSAALAQYEKCRRILAEELGVEPAESTQRLYRRIRSVTEIGAHNLPPQMTSFVGREAELRELSQRLAHPACRLLSLVGPGGIGKTRLALQLAEENRTAFLHGVCFVSLTTATSVELLVLAIADALHLHMEGQTDLKAQLLATLMGREMLLVLDNVEHIVQDGVPDALDFLADILRGSPEVKLLVTSRERLNLYGETVFAVQGLETPQGTAVSSRTIADCSAVALFLQSADRAQAGFTPVGAGWADIAHICRLVEGMPLAIELAAAWVRALSCQEIAAEIERNLAFLSTAMRGLPSRHRSVQATFNYSWDRLSAEQRAVFQKLSVFHGGFDREAALHVAGASLATLTALVDKSFLQETRSGRYTFHELMRQWAAEKLARDAHEAQTARHDHCRYYADLVDRAFGRFQAGLQREALDAMEAEFANARAAWQWAIAQEQYSQLTAMMDGLYTFCSVRNPTQGDLLFGEAVAALESIAAGQPGIASPHCLLGKLRWRWGHFARTLRPIDDTTEASFQHSVALLRGCNDQTELAQALHGLGRFLDAGGRYAEARQFLAESVEIGRCLQDQRYLAQALAGLGSTARTADELREAKQQLEEGLAIYRQLGDQRGMTYSLSALSGVEYYLGHQTEAKRLCLETEALLQKLGDLGSAAVMLSNAGHVCIELEEYVTAAHYLQEALQRSVALRQGRFPMNILHGLADLAFREGRYVQAYELASFVSSTPLTYPSTVVDAQQLLTDLETRLPPEISAAARARVESWSLDDVLADLEIVLE